MDLLYLFGGELFNRPAIKSTGSGVYIEDLPRPRAKKQHGGVRVVEQGFISLLPLFYLTLCLKQFKGHVDGFNQDKLTGVFKYIPVTGNFFYPVHILLFRMAGEENDRDFVVLQNFLCSLGPIHSFSKVDIHQNKGYIRIGVYFSYSLFSSVDVLYIISVFFNRFYLV